jgi:aldose sugar dehydrogenase
MKQILTTLLVCTAVIWGAQCGFSHKVKQRKAIRLFESQCATCHGEPKKFVQQTWKYGNSGPDIMESLVQHTARSGSAFPKLSADQMTVLRDYLLDHFNEGDRYDFSKNGPVTGLFVSENARIRLDTILTDSIDVPWGLAVLPNGDLLITDREGRLFRKSKITGNLVRIKGVPTVKAEGQGGLLDVETHPKFAQNNLIYLSYSKTRTDDDHTTTAVYRASLQGDSLSKGADIFVATPWQSTHHHYGSRLVFDREGFLWVSVGDRGQHRDSLPQKLDNDMGKIHRMFDDGAIPIDNPFVNVSGAHPTIWSYGHRNPQGMAMHPGTGAIWVTEHGPKGGDELNLIQKGKNYGWPSISHGINYDGSILTPIARASQMEQPQTYWVPSIGPSGLAFVMGSQYPAWSGSVLAGSLKYHYLDRCVLEGNQVTRHELLLPDVGRLRSIEMGSDGYLYIGLEDPGRVFRLLSEK